MRLFIGIWPPEFVIEILAQAQTAFRRLPAPGLVRCIPRDQIHVTLSFLGEVDDNRVEALMGIMRTTILGLRSFDLRLGEWGAFPNVSRARIIWVGCVDRSGELGEVQNVVAQVSNPYCRATEAKAFHAHLTLARVREAGARDRRSLAAAIVGLPKLRVAAWHVSNLRLVQSELRPEGPIYSTAAEIPLLDTR